MKIRLVVVKGPHLGEQFLFAHHEHFLVGRAPVAHFRLGDKDPYVSRLHFVIEANPPACRLLDLNSSNGTFLNGTLTKTADLKDGDLLQAGETTFRLSLVLEPHETIEDTVVGLHPPRRPDLGPGSRQDTAEVDNSFELIPEEAASVGWSPPGYRLLSRIGEGAMGTVYRARRLVDAAEVAVKIVKQAYATSPADRQRFLREIEVMRQVNHRHIVTLLEGGCSDEELFLVMELVEGDNLEQWVSQRKEKSAEPLPIATAVKLILPILDALHAAHTSGFVHRDVKPANIFLKREGRAIRPVLGDFGLARAYQETQLSGLTLTGELRGTLRYMAPEQITDARRAQPASDQYSAAATLYWLLAGRHTHDFEAAVPRALCQVLLEDPVPLAGRREGIPPGIVTAVHRALAKKTEERFPSIAEFRRALLASLRRLSRS